VQRTVDRRFNRARYDADKAVAAFAARLQDALDLDTVQANLIDAIHQALEPAHASVWTMQRNALTWGSDLVVTQVVVTLG
jgi:hypothetical protein